jgi:Mg2+ and Co2+ transporter CorA
MKTLDKLTQAVVRARTQINSIEQLIEAGRYNEALSMVATANDPLEDIYDHLTELIDHTERNER